MFAEKVKGEVAVAPVGRMSWEESCLAQKQARQSLSQSPPAQMQQSGVGADAVAWRATSPAGPLSLLDRAREKEKELLAAPLSAASSGPGRYRGLPQDDYDGAGLRGKDAEGGRGGEGEGESVSEAAELLAPMFAGSRAAGGGFHRVRQGVAGRMSQVPVTYVDPRAVVMGGLLAPGSSSGPSRILPPGM